MVHMVDNLGFSVECKENISGTEQSDIQDPVGPVNHAGRNTGTSASRTCSFVVTDGKSAGDPFCGAPARAGSSYCARHLPLCIVSRGSPEGRSRAAALIEDAEAAPEPPLELMHLRETALPESLPDDPRDFRALLDHPPPDPALRPSE
jgi:hypothetical protein